MNKKVALIILDGWGHGKIPEVSAIAQANTPNMDKLYQTCPNTELVTFGEEVGLPDGQMGNSEVGHLNIGAGRVVYQELARINKAAKDGTLASHPVLLDALNEAKKNGSKVHLMGLVSDGGVHSHINHLKALCDIVKDQGVKQAYIHAFLDGRDTDPKGGKGYLRDLLMHIDQSPVKIGTVIGRYYAMDRDKRWERTKKAYDLLVNGQATIVTDQVLQAVQQQYDDGITDEFMESILVKDDGKKPTIEDGDVVINFNFRTDRPRQISEVLTQKDMHEYNMHKLDIRYLTMTRYDETYQGVEVLFEKENLTNTIGEVLAKAGKTQLRIAETEKYPHVTFFFSGGREQPFEGEDRIMVASPKVATYDLQPEMSANEITDKLIAKIEAEEPDFICLNYANTDMVGHTGVFEAAVKAAETVDSCLGRLLEVLRAHHYSALIIADHGNSDIMKNPDGSPHTAHTTNPVPLIVVDVPGVEKVKSGKLGDLAPTILNIMGVAPPEEMTGEVLI